MKRKTKKIKPKPLMGMFLVSWKDMQKGTEIPLPMRAFKTYLEAEAYTMGCADVICVASEEPLDVDKVILDFIITQD